MCSCLKDSPFFLALLKITCNMRPFICLLAITATLLAPALSRGQNSDSTYSPPYQLDTPAKWDREHFPLPPGFAPQVPYKGMEDLRFAPGWANPASEEHWAYAFLWWLDGRPQLTPDSLSGYLQYYYTGLIATNIEPRKIPKEKLVPVKAVIKSGPASPGDKATFTGTVYMLDYLTQTPMTLNVIVHWKKLDLPDRSAVFFEISPRPLNHAIWTQLDQLNKGLVLPK